MARLRLYAKAFGDFEQPLLECAHRVNLLASIDDVEIFGRIITAIKGGANTLDDLVDETNLPESEVKRIWTLLLIEGDYEERPVGHKTDMARGRRPKGIFHKSDQAGNLTGGARGTRYSQYENPDEDDD